MGTTMWSKEDAEDYDTVDGRVRQTSAPYRYVWPSELDLMARIAGLRLRDRWAGWKRQPFPGNGIDQVVVYEKRAA